MLFLWQSCANYKAWLQLSPCRQRIEIRLAMLYMDLKDYPAALHLIGAFTLLQWLPCPCARLHVC